MRKKDIASADHQHFLWHHVQMFWDDHISGTKTNLPGLKLMLEVLRPGDTFVVWKLDRLGRTVKGLVERVNQLHDKQINFKSITDNLDTSTPSGRFFST